MRNEDVKTFFDVYWQLIDYALETIHKDGDNRGELLAVLIYLKKQLKLCKPRVLSQDVTQLALDICNKADTGALTYSKFITMPLWVEFDGRAVGEQDIDDTCYAAFLYPHQQDIHSIRCDLLNKNLDKSKSLYFDTRTGAWQYQFVGPCSGQCEYALKHTADTLVTVGQEHAAWLGDTCTCLRAGYTWSQMIKAVNHLLKYGREPVIETIEIRERTIPHNGNKLTKAEKVANSAAKKSSAPNIITISLSAPVHVWSTQAKTNDKDTLKIEKAQETISVQAHWRVLIPGAGKRWKELKVMLIDSYQRSGKSSTDRTIYKIEK